MDYTTDNPQKLGYRMPAEWENHAATWLSWPHQKEDWPCKFQPIPWVYAEIIRHIAAHEVVKLVIPSNEHKVKIRKILQSSGVLLKNVQFFVARTNRSWIRDYGPIYITAEKGHKALLDFRFNAWAKYSNWKNDDAIPGLVSKKFKTPSMQPNWGGVRAVLEGGSIDVDGLGTMLTTEECLLSKIQERNPGFGRKDYEELFHRYLGINKVVWLNRGIAGDDTHGHVDDLARFVSPAKVLLAVEEDRKDENYEHLQENFQKLKNATDARGKKIEVIPLPMPAPVVFEGQRLPASYANFYIANGIVLVPTFNDPKDRIALNIIAEHFPGRKVVGIHSVDLVWGLGTLHCLSQQEPA